MRAVVQHGIRDVRLEERPNPTPGAGEVLVRTSAVTICASDVHMFAEGNVGGVSWEEPFIPGHEAAGVVEDPNDTDLPAGTRVVLDPAVACHDCDMCAEAMFHLCRNLKFCDLPPVDGAMRELIAWPANRVFPVPESLDLVEAPLIEPLCVAVHALELASRPAGAVAAVAGCGAIGLFTLQMARLQGAEKIFATDPVAERLAVARELGADETIQVGLQDPVAEILRATGDRGVDLVFEAAGPQEALEQCLGVVRPAGEVVVIGIPSADEYRLQASSLRRRELTVRFVRRQNENYPQAVELVRRGAIKLGPMLTHRFPAERAQEAFLLAERKLEGAVRVAVVFD
ncbi:MAG: zinc-binding dehydrogenase [Armatimonadota bacterium]|nr:MAG: zinc-binding dehydrogenase [Armatimonadota bacterium]